MTPRVNVVASGDSRIRQLEEEVRALRNQLLEAERQKQLSRPNPVQTSLDLLPGDKEAFGDHVDVLEAQLQHENDTLRQDKQALARFGIFCLEICLTSLLTATLLPPAPRLLAKPEESRRCHFVHL